MSRSFWMWGVGTHKSTINILKLFNRIRSVKDRSFSSNWRWAVFFYAMEDVMEEIKSIQKIKILRRSLLRSRETARSEQCVLHGCRSIRDLEMKKEDRRGTPEKFKILRSELRWKFRPEVQDLPVNQKIIRRSDKEGTAVWSESSDTAVPLHLPVR